MGKEIYNIYNFLNDNNILFGEIMAHYYAAHELIIEILMNVFLIIEMDKKYVVYIML